MNARAQLPSQEIRTFRAANTRAALAAIKAALGSEAVILETREVGGLFGRAEIEVTAAPSVPPPPRAAAARPEAGASRDVLEGELERLRKELGEVRAALSAARANEPMVTPSPNAAPGRASVYGRLVKRGVEEDLAFALVREAEGRGSSNPHELLEEVFRRLRERLSCTTPPWLAPASDAKRPRVLALVGPTGVGKTTTVAKIAARALLESHLKVGLVTVDVYRIGASEQLARYGKIMGVPTFVAKDETSLADAVSRLRDMDLVLVDTAGRSDEKARADQARLLRSVPGLEIGLVLSAATGGRELAAAAHKHALSKPDLLAFSKLDEADGPGSIMSATNVIDRPIVCVTDGQRVPEDIRAASARELAATVLGR